MGVTMVKLSNPRRGLRDTSRSLGHNAMACLCGRVVEVSALAPGGLSPHRPHVLFKDGIRASRKERKATWCVVPELLKKAVDLGAVAF